MRKKTLSAVLLLSALVLPLVLITCQDDHYLVEEVPDKQDTMERLLELLESQELEPETRFTGITQILSLLQTREKTEAATLFLTNYVENHPEDPYNGYYLLHVARNYLQQGARSFAALYFDRILREYPDLIVQDQSIHHLSLTQLLEISTGPHDRLRMYQQLASRFPDRINYGEAFYHIGRLQGELGDWESAIQSWQVFLGQSDSLVTGEPQARQRVQTFLDLYNSDRSWVSRDLDSLVRRIRVAVARSDLRQLEALRNRIRFFAVAWEHENAQQGNNNRFDPTSFLRDILRNSRTYSGASSVVFSNELHPDSNENEAYLRSVGWWSLRVWYLYFRRIDFPPDPEIHGAWEWAGIYFGDKI